MTTYLEVEGRYEEVRNDTPWKQWKMSEPSVTSVTLRDDSGVVTRWVLRYTHNGWQWEVDA